MRKIWNWLKRDFTSVSMAIDYITKNRIPKWVIVVYYVMLFPIGLFLTPIGIVYGKYLQFKLNRIIKELKED